MRHFTLSNSLIWPFLPNYYCILKRITHIPNILTSVTVNEYYLQHYATSYHSFFHCLSCNANKLAYWIFLFALLPSKRSLITHFAYIWMYFFLCKRVRSPTFGFSFCIFFQVPVLWPDDDLSFRSKLVAI